MTSRSKRDAMLALLAVVVAVSGCASSPSGTSAATGASPSVAATVSSAAATAPPAASSLASSSALAPQAAQGQIGRDGSAAWSITPEGVYVSPDAGRTFSQLPLPPNVPPAAVTAVSSKPDGHAWIAVAGSGPSFTVYARDSVTAPWSQGVQLTPTLSANENLGGAEKQPWGASITSGARGQVLVVSELGLTHSVTLARIFVSADSGLTFTPTSGEANGQWDSVAIMGRNAVGVVGELINFVEHSGDTAMTWAPAVVNGVAPGFVAGTPVFVGPTVYLPVTEPDANDNGEFIVLRSTDGGATFNANGAQTLTLGGVYDPSPTAMAAAGATWWLVTPAGAVYRSPDNGLSWSKAPAAVPEGASGIGATDSQNATVTVEDNVCASGKTGCTSSQYFETTSDGGRTWTRT